VARPYLLWQVCGDYVNSAPVPTASSIPGNLVTGAEIFRLRTIDSWATVKPPYCCRNPLGSISATAILLREMHLLFQRALLESIKTSAI